MEYYYFQERNSISIDQVVYSFVSKEQMQSLLKEHILNNVIKVYEREY